MVNTTYLISFVEAPRKFIISSMWSSIVLYHAASKLSSRYNNIETGEKGGGGVCLNFAQLCLKIVFR